MVNNSSFPDPDKTWTADDGRAALEMWRRSGQPITAFAREHAVTPSRLIWWKRQFAKKSARSTTTSVTLVPAAVTSSDAAITIRVPGGVSIEISSGVPAQWIAAVVAELARATP
jgi:transposase-like protein